MLGDELGCFGPQGRDRLRGIVECDGKAVGLIIILHVTEDVVVNVAEEVHIRLDSPVVLRILQGRVLIEKSAIPPAHLMVRDLIGVLNIVLFQDLDGFLIEVVVDPRWCIPMLVRY